jgi:hypothetical protein
VRRCPARRAAALPPLRAQTDGPLHQLTVRYTGAGHDVPRYSCCRGHLDNGEPRCIAFGGLRADDAIEAELLKVLEPATVAAAVEAETQMAQHRDQVREALLRDLQAARYVADRAFRQYDAIDPANRLVAAELEARWNRALERVAEVEAKVADHDAVTPVRDAVAAGSFARLAEDLRAVWRAPTTDARLRKRIVRTVVQEVVADLDERAGEIVLLIHWMGGVHTELRLPRRRRGQRNSTSPDIIAAVRQLVLIATDDLIAGLLNRNGLKTGHGNRWIRERVTALRSHHGIPVHQRTPEESAPWLNLNRAAALLRISPKTLRLAAEAGRIEAVHPLPEGPWIFSRAALSAPAAMDIVSQARKSPNHPAGSAPGQESLPLSMT